MTPRRLSSPETLAPLALAVALAACAVSIDPVISDSDAVFDPRLLGAWQEADGSSSVVISRAGNKTYEIQYASEDQVGRFEARLGELGNRTFLDVWPAPGNTEVLEPYASLLIAGHLLAAVDIGANEIRLSLLQPDSLVSALRTGTVRLNYRQSGDQLIVLGTTEELRAALGAYVTRRGALEKPGVWRRTGS